MSYNLFLDDFRMPKDCTYVKDCRPYLNRRWIIARNYDEFVKRVEDLGIPLLISFDHDLADEHYAPTGISYDDFKEKTGYHCMQWLIDYLTDNNLPAPDVMVHSANPVGAENMEKLFENFLKHRENGIPENSIS